MTAGIEAIQSLLASAWGPLTGGRLWVLSTDDPLPESIGSEPVPTSVRMPRAGSVEVKRVDETWWWVAASRRGTEGAWILATAAHDGPWAPVLQSWADGVAVLVQSIQTGDGLTEALIDAWGRLSFLFELTQIAGRDLEPGETLGAVVRLLAQVVSVEQVFLVVPGPAGLIRVCSEGVFPPGAEALPGLLSGSKRPLTLEELRPGLTRTSPDLLGARDLLAAPIAARLGAGMIALLNPHERRFGSSDVQLIASVAEQVKALLEAADARAARAAQQRLEHELSLAADLQASLIPHNLPDLPGLDLAAYLHPARLVGGDLYDVATGDPGVAVLLLADVAGRGMPAALFTAILHAVFMSEATHRRDPGELLGAMNRLLHHDLARVETIATAIAVRVEANPPGFSYASAGHVEAALWREGLEFIQFLPPTGLPFGVDEGQAYGSRTFRLTPGDELVLYSDGLTEAEGPGGALLGVEGLSAIIQATHPARAADQVRVLAEAVDLHRGAIPLRDDLAALVVKAVGNQASTASVVPFVAPASLPAVRELVDFVRATIRSSRPKDVGRSGEAGDFALAFSEIATNQVEHAYRAGGGLLAGCLTLSESAVSADLYDRGDVFDTTVSERPPPDPGDPPDRGYGLRLARGLLDHCTYRRLPGGRNHWRLVRSTRGAVKP